MSGGVQCCASGEGRRSLTLRQGVLVGKEVPGVSLPSGHPKIGLYRCRKDSGLPGGRLRAQPQNGWSSDAGDTPQAAFQPAALFLRWKWGLSLPRNFQCASWSRVQSSSLGVCAMPVRRDIPEDRGCLVLIFACSLPSMGTQRSC